MADVRILLALNEKDPHHIFEGEALLRMMNRYGVLDESQNKLDYVLALTTVNILECRLKTLVFKSGMAKSIHHARVLIRQRHIKVGRVKQKNQKSAAKKATGGDGDEEDEE
ncbi:hypothetical protein RDI58_026917 [Solanum bulbocastanum]|uniref:RNA-binding S4 domain-containing protein n=1 Tax=Solanum bulbocastanum TaxID=147425 RepID=A0AAN8Y1M9_SOLBU